VAGILSKKETAAQQVNQKKQRWTMRPKQTHFTRNKFSATARNCLVIIFGVLILLSSFSLASAADWIKLGATRERSEAYCDRETITRDGDIVTVRVKTSLVEETARHFLFRINCPEATFSISEPIGKEIPGEKDRAYKFTPWEVNCPGSLADGLRDYVCERRTKKK
jgi:hypothetical protein